MKITRATTAATRMAMSSNDTTRPAMRPLWSVGGTEGGGAEEKSWEDSSMYVI